jgi:hypothetical protein
MSEKLNSSIAVIGIDIARTRSTWWATISAVQSCCGRSSRVASWKHGWPTCHRAGSAWRRCVRGADKTSACFFSTRSIQRAPEYSGEAGR